jgi:hypothetical protein
VLGYTQKKKIVTEIHTTIILLYNNKSLNSSDGGDGMGGQEGNCIRLHEE